MQVQIDFMKNNLSKIRLFFRVVLQLIVVGP